MLHEYKTQEENLSPVDDHHTFKFWIGNAHISNCITCCTMISNPWLLIMSYTEVDLSQQDNVFLAGSASWVGSNHQAPNAWTLDNGDLDSSTLACQVASSYSNQKHTQLPKHHPVLSQDWSALCQDWQETKTTWRCREGTAKTDSCNFSSDGYDKQTHLTQPLSKISQ